MNRTTSKVIVATLLVLTLGAARRSPRVPWRNRTPAVLMSSDCAATTFPTSAGSSHVCEAMNRG
jgi:hypothetical protein